MSDAEEEYLDMFGTVPLLLKGITENEDEYQQRVEAALKAKKPMEHFDDLGDVEY